MTETNAARHRILIVGPAWVGDMVMAHSLIQMLAQQHDGDVLIDVLGPAWALPLTARMQEVNDGIVSPFAHGELNLRGRLQLAHHLRQRHYQQCIVLPNSLKSALLPFAARIPTRTGFIGEQRFGLLNDIRRLDKEKLPLTVERFCALSLSADAPAPESIPRPQLRVDATDVHKAMERFAPPSAGPVLALCPGAEYGPSKQWPAEHFAELAISRIQAGWNVWIFGSAKDASFAAQIMTQVSMTTGSDEQLANLCGLTNLGEAIDLLSRADVVVSNDSGLMHVACAVAAPVVALFGSTTPAMTPPLGERHLVLEQQLDCRPCFKRSCPLGHLNCLKLTTPVAAAEAVQDLYNATQA